MDHKLPIHQAKSEGTIASVLREVEPRPDVSHVYLHVPFCFHKCHYCDFYSLARTDQDEFQAFVSRMEQELEAAAEYVHHPVQTIYVGGGTPTLLGPALWQRLVDVIRTCLQPSAEVEWTVEANPETVTPDLMGVLAGGGVNRISIGCQTFSPDHLKTLERWHEPASVRTAVESARAAGIDNISLDLIFAIPGQTRDQWQDDLNEALALAPEHLSCYALTYEPGTPLAIKQARGEIEAADEDLEADMFILTRRLLHDRGYQAYEISNFALPGRESRHNLAYWLDKDWLACGPSASGHVAGYRWKNQPSVSDYLHSATPWPPIVDLETPDPARALAERLMMGLRLADGLLMDSVLAQADAIGAGRSIQKGVQRSLDDGHLAIRAGGRICLTDSGLLLADTVIRRLMDSVQVGPGDGLEPCAESHI